jgi:hypothetical protein
LRTRTKLVHGGAAGGALDLSRWQIEAIESGPTPRRLVALDDEGRGVGVEAVAVRLEHAVGVLHKVEREGVERQAGAEPDVFRGAGVEIRLEMPGVARSPGAVDAVGGDDHVGVRQPVADQSGLVADLALEMQRDAYLFASPLQDFEQLLARDAGEPVSARGDDPIADVDVDVVPVGQRGGDPRERLGIGGPEVDHRLVGEDHAPAEGIVAAIALEHGDVGVGPAPLEQQGDVQPGWAAANDRDLHREALMTGRSLRHGPGPAVRG